MRLVYPRCNRCNLATHASYLRITPLDNMLQILSVSRIVYNENDLISGIMPVVAAAGFEPATSSLWGWQADQTALHRKIHSQVRPCSMTGILQCWQYACSYDLLPCHFTTVIIVNGPTLSICATLAYPSRPRFTLVSASPNLWLFSFTTDGSVCRRDLRQPLISPLMRFRMQKPIHRCVKAIPLSILHSTVDLHHITHNAPLIKEPDR